MAPSRSTVGRRSLAVLCAATLGVAALGVGCAATPEPELQPQPPVAPPAAVAEEVPVAEAPVEPAAPAEEVVAPVTPEPEPVAEAMTVDDEVIATKILLKFAADARLSLYAIDVRSTDGHVVLAGSVGSQQAREAAEALARQTAGVRSVENRLSTD